MKSNLKVRSNIYPIDHDMFQKIRERHQIPVPNFIKQQGAEVIIAGGMGMRAIEFFNQLGIEAVTGASGRVADVINSYLKGNLQGAGPCR